MQNLARLDWPHIISILGLIIATAELTLKIIDLRKPPEARQKRAGLLVFHLIKKNFSNLRRVLYNLRLRLYRRKQKKTAKIFISYKRDVEPDEDLAMSLFQAMKLRGHQPYIDKHLVVGIAWSKEIHNQIKASDYLIVLLSEAAAKSEMVAEELNIAEECYALSGHPITLPIRINYLDELPYHLYRHIGHLHYVMWRSSDDDFAVQDALFRAIEGGLALPSSQANQKILHPRVETSLPEPKADPRLIEVPSGVVGFQSPFYIRRNCDEAIERQISNRGSTSTIRAGRQMGKTSLLVRAVRQAKGLGYQVVYIDFQAINKQIRSSLDDLLKHLAEEISFHLSLNDSLLQQIWLSPRGSADKFNQFIETVVLDERCPFMLAIDEADQLLGVDFKTDFFALLRSWDTRRAYDLQWSCLHIAIVISTHPHLLINDHMQSPFNVGLRLELEDFTPDQVTELNKRYQFPMKENELPGLMRLLGGHPYLTRQAFYSMIDQQLNWMEIEQIATSERSPFRSHLHFYLSQLAQQTTLVDGLKEIFKTRRCANEDVLYRLSAAGLVRELSNQEVEVRCGLYEQYFKKALNV